MAIHQMSMEEKADFVRDGYLLVPGVLGKTKVDHLSAALDRVRNLVAGAHGVPLIDGFNLLDFMGLDEAFINLVDHPKTFPKLWAILGWNLCIFHSHLIVTPPLRDTEAVSRRHLAQRARPTATQSKEVKSVEDWWGWHRDSGQVNDDLGDGVPPRLSVKIAYYLSDALGANDANMWVVPGSHVEGRMQPEFPGPKIVPPGAVPIRIAAGSAVLFDRRIVHSSSPDTRVFLHKGTQHDIAWLVAVRRFPVL